MKVLGIDQSLSKTAFCEMVDGEVVNLSLSKTGASKVKGKRPDTTYYDDLHDQIHHICLDMVEIVSSFNPEIITFEALSFGSVGDATRNLSELMGAMRETLKVNYNEIPVTTVAPTSLKSYARDFLKPDRQFEGLLKTGKPKKVKMDKKMVVEAAKELYGQDYLKGYNYSSGLDDLADATFLAHKTWSEYATKKKS
jgi:Holliday junction resolvasome RuvABC endonuclease subunit